MWEKGVRKWERWERLRGVGEEEYVEVCCGGMGGRDDGEDMLGGVRRGDMYNENGVESVVCREKFGGG